MASLIWVRIFSSPPEFSDLYFRPKIKLPSHGKVDWELDIRLMWKFWATSKDATSSKLHELHLVPECQSSWHSFLMLSSFLLPHLTSTCHAGSNTMAINACASLLWDKLLVDDRRDSPFFAEFSTIVTKTPHPQPISPKTKTVAAPLADSSLPTQLGKKTKSGRVCDCTDVGWKLWFLADLRRFVSHWLYN